MSIIVENLSFSYTDKLVLKNINFEVSKSMLVNILGPNGVGKSTLFKCMLGLNTDYSGDVFLNGKNIKNLSIKQRSKEISYIPQSHSPVFNYDVIDFVVMSTATDLGMMRSPGKEHRMRAYEALDRIGISELANRAYTQISGGERQMVLIARAIAQGAKTIVMDEPTSALDYGNTVRVLSCVRDLASDGLSIVQSTHQPDQAFLYSSKTLVLHDGRVLAFGEPKDVITDKLISKIYGIDVEVNSLYEDQIRVCVPKNEVKNDSEN